MLYEHAISLGDGQLTSFGALATSSGEKTGRSPKDKRVVESESSKADVWWGDVNRPISEESFDKVRAQAIAYLEKIKSSMKGKIVVVNLSGRGDKDLDYVLDYERKKKWVSL